MRLQPVGDSAAARARTRRRRRHQPHLDGACAGRRGATVCPFHRLRPSMPPSHPHGSATPFRRLRSCCKGPAPQWRQIYTRMGWSCTSCWLGGCPGEARPTRSVAQARVRAPSARRVPARMPPRFTCPRSASQLADARSQPVLPADPALGAGRAAAGGAATRGAARPRQRAMPGAGCLLLPHAVSRSGTSSAVR